MSTDVFCLKSFQGHKFMSNDHSIQFCSNNETFFCWGEMMTATSSSGKGWSLMAVLTFGVVNSFLTLFFFLTGCSCTQSVVLVLLGCCEHGNSEWGCVRFALWRRWVTDWQDLVIQSAHTQQTCHFFWIFQKSIKDWEFDCCQQHHAPSQPNWHALHPKSAVFCLLRLSGTLSVQSLAPLWSLIVSLLEAVFTSHFATKDQWTCEKTGDHFPQLTRCVKWNDWSILVTMWIFTQGKPKIAWGETLLSDFFHFPEWFIHPSKRTFTEQQVISLDVPCWLSKQVKMPCRWNNRFARCVQTKWQDPWLMTKKWDQDN